MKKNLLLITFFSVLYFLVHSEIPAGYYNEAHGKMNSEIKTALHNTIREHTYLSFTSSNSQTWWNVYFKQTDWHPDDYFWDMYSTDRYSDYDGSRQHREHCMPRSWWLIGTNDYGNANGDLFNLYPANATANNRKSNNPLGIVGNATFDNGVVKVGSSTLNGYTGTVFEPADEYKGDFARTYMYMVTCYEDYADRWTGLGIQSMLENNTYPTLNEYSIDLLMQWHIDDPVSQKELDRNEAVYILQKNRNPFIDLPQIALYIWGDSVNAVWNYWIEPPVFLDYFAENKYIFIYSNNSLFIESNNQQAVEFRIYSMDGKLGQVLKTETNIPSYINLPRGFYIIEIMVENNALYQRLFIE